jgi:hypothetical protein
MRPGLPPAILPLALLPLAALATVALAETPLTADGFAAHVTGKTITYQQFDTTFGIEQYLAGRKVRWSVAPDECQYGSWYPQGDDICFVYEYDPTPHCWTFWLRGGVLAAQSADAQPGTPQAAELSEIDRSDTPLACPGPQVGA